MTKRSMFIIAIILVALGIALVVIGFGMLSAKARTITVDDSGGADYTTIQGAIDAASAGDTVYVCNGSYHECVFINKTIELIGQNRYETLIDCAWGVCISASGAKISEFTVIMNESQSGTGSGRSRVVETPCGISAVVSNITISSNIILRWFSGIFLCDVQNVTITSNTIAECSYGIDTAGSFYDPNIGNSTISYNTITNCSYGLFAELIYNASISHNTITDCAGAISFYFRASGNSISHNNIYGNGYGLKFDYYIQGVGNTAYDNWWGDASGPNATGNPNGTGDAVIAMTEFYPWAESKFNDSPPNQPPFIRGVLLNSILVYPGERVFISVDAGDWDSPNLSYSYCASVGAVEANGSFANWTAPLSYGKHPITVIVNDGERNVERTLNVTVTGHKPITGNVTYEVEPLPGFESVALISVLLIITLALTPGRRKIE